MKKRGGSAGFVPLEVKNFRFLSARKRITPLTGFTLIELLVVIAIVGILASIIVTSLISARSKARDSKRLADLKTISTALEFYYDDTGHYPLATTWVTGCNRPGTANWIPDGADYTWNTKYISSLPRDPSEDCSSASPKSYAYWSDGSTYKVTTELEGVTNPSTSTGQTISYNGNTFTPTNSPLTVTFSSPLSNITNESPIPITATFSSSVVDFTQTILSITNAFINSFLAVTNTIYTFVVSPQSNGQLSISVGGGTVHDTSGNSNAPAQFIIVYDSLRPHPALSPDPLPSSVGGPFSLTVNFNLPVNDFTLGDINVTNGTASGLSMIGPGTNTNYTFTVTPTSHGQVTVSIPDGVVTTAAGNTNVISNILTTNF